MTDSEIRALVLHLSETQRRMIVECSQKWAVTYEALANKLNCEHRSIQTAGRQLQEDGLAVVVPVRLGRRYNGSRMFLTAAGELVQKAVLAS